MEKDLTTINIDSIAFRYGQDRYGLQISNLQFASHCSIAITGSSGCGKTTLLNLLSGLLPYHCGSITVLGKCLHQLNDAKKRDLRSQSFGFIFQDFRLIEHLNVADNILYPYYINESLKLNPSIKQRMYELLEVFHLAHYEKRSINELSQGEQQRIAVCRALISKPEILLADEATENLDPDNKQLVYDQLFQHVALHGATLIAVTHDHDYIDQFDQVVRLDTLLEQEKA